MRNELIKIRRALELLKENSFLFKNFPNGCCGSSCYLIATYLEEKGLGTFDYICGQKENALETHAWLLSKGEQYIIDLTADQFDCEPIIYLKGEHPLSSIFNQQSNLGNASIQTGSSVDSTYYFEYERFKNLLSKLDEE